MGPDEDRSAAEQINHRTRVGQSVALHRSASRRRVEAVLTGALPMSVLRPDERDIVNAELDAAITAKALAAPLGASASARGVPGRARRPGTPCRAPPRRHQHRAGLHLAGPRCPRVSRLDLVVGPNGAGKSTYVAENLRPRLPPGTPFVNADEIARARFPGEEVERAREAAIVAEATRNVLLERQLPFIAETVFSHPLKLDLVDRAVTGGCNVMRRVLAIPSALAVERVRYRVADGGQDVPPDKVVQRWERLWPLVADAICPANHAEVWDNSQQHQIHKIAEFVGGLPISPPGWPAWTPPALRDLA